MVASIPSPALSSLLPAFLSHIPASFASPKPPPSLPPLLTPLTRSRLTHLSFSLGNDSDSSWLSLLTWSSTPSDGKDLQEHLASQDYYFLHQAPSPNTFVSKGYRRLDCETLQTLISIPELEIIVLYQFIAEDIISESGEIGHAWKVHDVRLADDEERAFLPAGRFWDTIDSAEAAFVNAVPKYSTASYSYSGFQQSGSLYQQQQQQEDDDDDDDYWGRYDDEETESVAGDQDQVVQQPQSHVQIAASMLARRVLQDQPAEEDEAEKAAEEEYYARYATVEPVLDNHPQSAPAPGEGGVMVTDRRDSISTNITSTSTTFDAQTMSTPLTAFTHPSTKVSPVMTAADVVVAKTSHPKPEVASTKKVIAGLESAAEVHTQSEVAIQQHVSTSIKSLYRLWKAGGMDAEEFGRFLEREVEVLKVVDEAGELGS